MTKQTDELAALKAGVEQLERANKPPEPFKPAPYEPIDWTARMSMPPSALRAMVEAVPDHVIRDIAMRDGRAPTGPSSQGAIPSSQQVSNVRPGGVPGGGTGWAREIPLGPSMHQRYVDAQLDAQDARDKAERIRQDAQLQAMQRLAEPKHD
jgi:hypothetical protein